MWKFTKMLIGIGLIPLAAAITLAVINLYKHSITTTTANHWESWALPVGFMLWVLIFFILPRPTRTYVLGHELTHAMWALLMGGRIGKMKVGKDGGHVELSKTNFVITLAPYFFPFYTFLVLTAYYLMGLFWNMAPYRLWGLGAVGFTWAFHITFTIHMLTENQPDVQEHGRIFSYAVIYSMNILTIGIWMALVGSPTFKEFGILLWEQIRVFYMVTYGWVVSGWNYVINLSGNSAA